MYTKARGTLFFKNKKIFTARVFFLIFVFFGSVLAGFAFLISPHPHTAKLLNVFPAVSIGGFTITLMEIYSAFGCIALLGLNFADKLVHPGRSLLNQFPPSFEVFLSFIFLFNLFLAVLLGFLLNNEKILASVRVSLFILVFSLFYMYRFDILKYERFFLCIVNFIGVVFATLAVLYYFYPLAPRLSLLPANEYVSGIWFPMYFTVFSIFYYTQRILVLRFRVIEFLFLLISVLSVVLRVTNKPLVAATFVGGVIILVVVVMQKKSSIKKIALMSSFLALSISTILLSPVLKGVIFSTIADRFFKVHITTSQSQNISIYELLTLEPEQGGGRDLSGGRFELWENYFHSAVNNPLVSPNFGKEHPLTYISDIGREVSLGPHNILAEYSYYVGYPAAIALFFLFGIFYIKGYRVVRSVKRSYVKKDFATYSSIYAYICSIIVVEMVGGPVGTGPNFTWFFAILVSLFIAKSSFVGKSQFKTVSV
jgi:hypothetical protein